MQTIPEEKKNGNKDAQVPSPETPCHHVELETGYHSQTRVVASSFVVKKQLRVTGQLVNKMINNCNRNEYE